MLIARGAKPHELYAVVAEEVARVVDASSVGVARYKPDGTATMCGTFPPHEPLFRTGAQVSVESANILGLVRDSADPARVENHDELEGEIADAVRRNGMRSTLGVPIMVAGRVWGAIVASSTERLPENTTVRLAEFTEVLAAAIANTEAREALARLADEQAALRRVATLVAQNAAPAEIFAAVSAEVDRVFGLDPATFDVAVVGRFDPGPELVVVGLSKSVEAVQPGSSWPPDDLFAPTHVFRTGRSARIGEADLTSVGGEVADFLRHHGYVSQVASPIVVEGRLWGAMSVNGRDDFPPDTEERLERFTELIATAIANAESREVLARLADQQAALRRVATLVAQGVRPIGAEPEPLFRAVATEVQALLGSSESVIVRFEDDETATTLGTPSGFPAAGTRHPLDPNFAVGAVRRTRHAARFETDDPTAAGMPAVVRETGVRSAVASPIIVEGEVWGAICVASLVRSLPPDTERRLADFTELVATAIADADSREVLARLAEQQAALRRVATLVAEGAAPGELFTAVAWEVGQLFHFAAVTLNRYEKDAVVVLADPLDSGFPVGSRWPFDGDSLAVRVHATRRMARIDDYSDIESSAAARMRARASRSAIGVPIFVEGDLWGLLCVGAAARELLPADTADRIAGFVELVGTAISNGQARDGLRSLADEQAALRRVATLVARDAPPGEVFDAVAMEVGKLLDTDITIVGRYDADGAATAIGSWSAVPGGVPVGTRSAVGGRNVLTLVAETERPARVDGYDDTSGEAAEIARRHGWRSSIAAPISVEGRLWGVMLVATQRSDPFPAGAEERLSAFTDLVATAIANAESQYELAASRRRIVAAADEARRRIERDLHDGIQQRLIALSFRARAMMRRPPDELPGIAAELSDGLKDVSAELREVSRGIHPTILTEAGLGPALRALARRSDVPVDLDVRLAERLPEPVEAAAYYIASEALTNVAKHAHANVVQLVAAHDDGILTLEVSDDGIGGVDPARGSGILGLTDRAEALGGTISIASPPRSGTTLSVRLPITT
ncbi:MAG TPA: GAF domain-containing sensor histidine kinase [Gaiellaceae bacterium]|nr:GAF domain-containing sensor histidine kinase [Gaiellaceae bacterium]